MGLTTTVLVVGILSVTTGQEFGGHALFVKTAAAHSRVQRDAPVSAADLMAQNILEWIQGIYRQGARKIRQQSDSNAYLPPYTTQRPPERPRPFQPAPNAPASFPSNRNEVTSYQRPSSLYTPPNVPGFQSVPTSTPRPTFSPVSGGSQQPSTTYLPQALGTSTSYSPRPRPTFQPGYSNAGPTSFPPLAGSTSGTSGSTTYLPPQTGFTTPRPPATSGFSPTFGYTTQRPFPPGSTGGVSGQTLRPPNLGGYPSTTYGYPSERPSPGFPTAQGPGTVNGVSESTGGSGYPSSSSPSPPFPTPGQEGQQGQAGESTGADASGSGATGSGTALTTTDGETTIVQTTGEAADDESKHPPHIHNIEVQCSKTMMTIKIEFNREFNGVIYSKGFFMNPDCRYVEQNSGKTEYSFTVSLDSCGTQFINDFEGEAGQAYLENVLVLQNEPGIQEVWDTVRRVRCLWEGNINKALSVSLSVDMLNQEIVTFSGDTASAKLDIQIGRGPFAPAADGLVKIGETMTLVVSVEGDPAFDLQVRDCVARDESSTNVVQLTDERGCILKPKIFGAFQKTNDTGNTGASIIAYAFFQAFKFPDVMDLFIECNVELCKTDCEPCPDPNQQIEPGRRRRSVSYGPANTSAVLLADPVRVGRGFRVIMLDDLSTATGQLLENLEETAIEGVSKSRNVCISNAGFFAAFCLMLSMLVITTISAAVFYAKLQRVYRAKSSHS